MNPIRSAIGKEFRPAAEWADDEGWKPGGDEAEVSWKFESLILYMKQFFACPAGLVMKASLFLTLTVSRFHAALGVREANPG